MYAHLHPSGSIAMPLASESLGAMPMHHVHAMALAPVVGFPVRSTFTSSDADLRDRVRRFRGAPVTSEMSSTILLAIVTIAGTFGFMYFQRRKLATQHAHLRAGQLAPRLGMQLVEGDPEFNLAIQSVQPSVQNVGSAGGFLKQIAKTQLGGTLGELKLRMTGQPYGVPAELVLYCKQDYSPGVIENVTTTWFDLRLTVQTRAQLAPFELRLRKEMTGLEARRRDGAQPMPIATFGDPMLDQRYVIESSDPGTPRRIAAALGVLAPHLMYVHVVAEGNRVSFVMTPTSVMCSATSLEPILHALVSIAAALEGRPLPVAA